MEASSDAPATVADRFCVVSAVRVSVPAADSSWVADVATLATMAPTALSKSSAKRISSARRASAVTRLFSSCSAVSRSAFAIACILNSSTALAIWPISSLRPRPGRTTSNCPEASSRIDMHSATIGPEMPRPSSSAHRTPRTDDTDGQRQHELLRAGDERLRLALNAAFVSGRADLDGLRVLDDRIGQ